jgi:hypothetical protein
VAVTCHLPRALDCVLFVFGFFVARYDVCMLRGRVYLGGLEPYRADVLLKLHFWPIQLHSNSLLSAPMLEILYLEL